jgi:hypothetical protein
MTKVARPTKRKPILTFVHLLGALLLIAVALAPKGALAGEKKGQLHVTKNCSEFTGTAGTFCTITSSNLAQIKVGSKVFYDQAANIPTGMLDSNAVLNVGPGDWAVGRCTLDLSTTSRTVHLLGRNGRPRGVQCSRRCIAISGRRYQLGWDVQLRSAS